jgi:zinc/manganese transport system permease protein
MLVSTTHVPLGQEVLRRGIIFIDLAIAQIAALGVLIALVVEWENPWMVQASAVFMALAGAWLLSHTERRWPNEQEAIIGVSFVLASSGGVLLLANDPHGGEHLKSLLAGQILWVDWRQLALAAVVYFGILIAWYRYREKFGQIGFYYLFAIAVTISVQLVGVYLVFASLILPALAAINTPPRRRLHAAYLVAFIGYALGIPLSAMIDMPTGAVITWMLAATAVIYRIGNRFMVSLAH